MKPVNWGVLSTAKIGRERVIPALQQSPLCNVHAIASRDQKRAEQATQSVNIECFYGSYDALLADPVIEAVYIPLPNDMHVDWSVKALNAGKHVLCEKPIACTAADVQPLLAARERSGMLIEEAFMVRDHPQWERVRQLITTGRIGALRNVQLSYCHFTDDPNDIRNQVSKGGGGLLDVGCYCCTIARLIFDAEPQRVFALTSEDPRFAVDRFATAVLEFADGHASFFCSTQSSRYQMVQIIGTTGWIRVEVPFAHPPDLSARIVIGRDIIPGTEPVETITLPPVNQYQLQAERFSRQIRGIETTQWPLETAVANMRVIDAIRASAQTGGWINIE